MVDNSHWSDELLSLFPSRKINFKKSARRSQQDDMSNTMKLYSEVISLAAHPCAARS